ncbi:MAG: FecR domain-containing protein [Treponema sp.]|nr:FecR domain-containing protein [Treponema sp.]
MKKIITALLISFLSFEIFAIEAKVVSVTGKVQKQRGAAWVDLKPGDVIAKGELIQTGFKSEAVLSLTSANQKSTIKVAPLSRVTIEQLSETATEDTASLAVTSGSVKSDIQKTKDNRVNYSVRSPVATASVRGTIVGVGVKYDSTSIFTGRGEVEACYNDSKTSFKISAGQSADFDKKGNISSPFKSAYHRTSVLGGSTIKMMEREIEGFVYDSNIMYESSEGSSGGEAAALSVGVTVHP